MKVVGEYNKLTEGLKKKILRKLKVGEVVTFQMLTGHDNIDPDPEEVRKYPVLFPTHAIPAIDVIQDPESYEAVDIAYCSMGANKTVVIKSEDLIPGIGGGLGFRLNGKFSITGGSIDAQEKYDYLTLCNYNARNEYRDTNKAILFAEIDVKAESLTKTKTRNILTQALNKADSLQNNLDEAYKVAASLNWPKEKEPAVLLDKLGEYAQKYPDKFMDLFDNPMTELKSIIKQALENEVLSYDLANGTMSMGAQTLTSFIQSKQGFDYLTAFAEWINTANNGKNVLDTLKKKLKTKKEVATS